MKRQLPLLIALMVTLAPIALLVLGSIAQAFVAATP
jgi:hypothetical protein